MYIPNTHRRYAIHRRTESAYTLFTVPDRGICDEGLVASETARHADKYHYQIQDVHGLWSLRGR